MILRLPDLRPGVTYTFQEVEPFVAADDLRLVNVGFPKHLEEWPSEDILGYRPNEPVLLEYHVLPIQVLEQTILEWHKLFDESQDHKGRVAEIANRLQGGEMALPVFVQKNDPHKRIVEGFHRAVAMWLLNSAEVPVLYTKYADW